MGNTAVQITTVGECAAVLPGFSAGSAMEHDPAGTHQVVLARHLSAGAHYEYRPADEFRLTPGGRDAGRYEVQAGDVLFMSRGTRNLASVVVDVPGPTLAPVSFYILRPKPEVEPGYLAWYLNHPRTQAAIGQIRTGAGTPIVQRQAFAELPVILPPLRVQQKIAAVNHLLAREADLLTRLAEVRSRINAFHNDEILRRLEAGPTEGRRHPDD